MQKHCSISRQMHQTMETKSREAVAIGLSETTRSASKSSVTPTPMLTTCSSDDSSSRSSMLVFG